LDLRDEITGELRTLHEEELFDLYRSFNIDTGWMIEVLGFGSWRGLGIFLFTTTSRMTMGPTQPPIQWVPGALSLGIKRPGSEADKSPPSNAEVKE
jgi:hypothetical protein